MYSFKGGSIENFTRDSLCIPEFFCNQRLLKAWRANCLLFMNVLETEDGILVLRPEAISASYLCLRVFHYLNSRKKEQPRISLNTLYAQFLLFLDVFL